MGVAYFIVLDNPSPGFDTFVNGKAILRDLPRITKLAKSLGLNAPNDYFALSLDDMDSLSDELDLSEDLPDPEERWFDPDEGLTWITKLSAAIESNPSSMKNSKAVLNDLKEYEGVLLKAKAIGAKWHFSIDY